MTQTAGETRRFINIGRPTRKRVSDVRTLFRFCPGCGKRFEVRLQSKKLLDERVEQTEITRDTGSLGIGLGQPGYAMSQPVIVEEKVPITIDVEEFQYTYRCKHCGHVWSEMHAVQRKFEPTGESPK